MEGPAEIQNKSEGSGLGLFLSASLAKLLNGKLWLDYSNEKGSRFCFNIPIERGAIQNL
jgi:signal transduction histidine kinase